MREIDKRCAEILGWKDIELEKVTQWNNEQELYGLPPWHGDRYRVPYYSEMINIAFQYLIEELKRKKVDITINWKIDINQWLVYLVKGSYSRYYTDNSLAMAIAISFIRIHEVGVI